MNEKKKKKKKKKLPRTAAEAARRVSTSKNVIVYDHGQGKLILSTKKQARLQGFRDYVTDPEQRGRDATYYRKDRNYPEVVTHQRWKYWFEVDEWGRAREEFWIQAQQKLLATMADNMVDMHMQEISELSKKVVPLYEYLEPLKDENGEWIRDEETGLPKYALELGRVENVGKLVLALMDKIKDLRGDVLHRTDVIARAHRDKEESEAEGEQGSRFGEAEQQTLSKIARMMLVHRHPALGESVNTDSTEGGENDDDQS